MYSRLIRWLLLPTLIKVRKAQYWGHYHEMLETDKLSLNELRNIQFTRLKQILEHAQKNVVFYQERLQKSGIITQDIKCLSDLTQIPITTTEDVRLNFPDRIIAGNLDKTNMVYTATSGTTMRTESVFDNHKANLNWAAILRAHKQAGGYNLGDKWMDIPPPICTTTCGEEKITSYGKPARSQFFNLTRKLNSKELKRHIIEYAYAKAQKIYRRMSLPSLWKAGTTIPEKSIRYYIEEIRKYKPYLLKGLPIYIYAIAKFILENQLEPPKVEIIKPLGGSMTRVMKQRIEKAFKCRVYDTYGCSEAGCIAFECDLHHGLHYLMDLYYIEICRDNRPVNPGELGRVYLTDLTNKAMPLIRYEIGDLARFVQNEHDCRFSADRIEVVGRIEDTLVNNQGRIFSSDEVFDFFHSHAEINNFQLIEKGHKSFELLVVPNQELTIDKEKLTNEFNEFYGEKSQINFHLVRTINSENGGKFRFVKSLSHSKI